MQSNLIKLVKQVGAIILASTLLITACNKDLPKPEPIPIEEPVGQSIGEIVSTDTNYSFFKTAITKAGMLDILSDKTKVYTVFAPNNNAFRGLLTALGLPPFEATIDVLPTETVVGIVNYHIIGGQKISSTVIPTSFPNVQEPTNLVLQDPFFRMSVFPSKMDNQLFANNIPITVPDIVVANGVMHGLPGVLVPPDKVMAEILAADTSLSFFLTAVARADSGQTDNLSKFSYLLAYPPTNFTVFAPDNNAFRRLLRGLGLPPSSAVINFLPVQTVRGLVAYHFLGVRTFTANIPTSPISVPTLLAVNPSPPVPVILQTTLIGVTAYGIGNQGVTAFVTKANLHGVNGVVQVIDRVLLPQ